MSSTVSSHSASPSTSSITHRTRTDTATSIATTTTSDASVVGDTIGHDVRPRFFTPALPTPTWPGEQGAFSLSCSTTINAPLQLLLALMLDTRTYPRWNAFCPSTRVTHQPRSTAPLPPCLRGSPAVETIANLPGTLRDGTSFVMEVCLDTKNQSKRTTAPSLQVSHLEQFTRGDDETGDSRVGVRLAWRIKGKVAEVLTRSERVQEFVMDPRDPTVTEYVCWETYYGVLATGMRHVFGKQIKEGYCAWMDGLKGFAEAEWQRQTSPARTPPGS